MVKEQAFHQTTLVRKMMVRVRWMHFLSLLGT